MIVRSRSIASTESSLSRDRRSDRSSLIAEKSRPTLTCVTAGVQRVRGYTAALQRGRMGLVLVGLFIDAL